MGAGGQGLHGIHTLCVSMAEAAYGAGSSHAARAVHEGKRRRHQPPAHQTCPRPAQQPEAEGTAPGREAPLHASLPAEAFTAHSTKPVRSQVQTPASESQMLCRGRRVSAVQPPPAELAPVAGRAAPRDRGQVQGLLCPAGTQCVEGQVSLTSEPRANKTSCPGLCRLLARARSKLRGQLPALGQEHCGLSLGSSGARQCPSPLQPHPGS